MESVWSLAFQIGWILRFNMQSSIQDMLKNYNCQSPLDFRNALKEIVQEIVLLGLSRAGFFNIASFYGGTCLRIFYGLDRFSEELDFSLIRPDENFDLNKYLPAVREELSSFGFEMEVDRKPKSEKSPIQSAFVKGGTLVQLAKITSLDPIAFGIPKGEIIRIKLEIDTDPPEGASFETKYQLIPIPYSVLLFDKPSLFAGKVHALLCRNWKTRVKGRDFYDYVWYLSKEIPLNLIHLQKRMIQSGHISENDLFDHESILQKLKQRFETVDFSGGKSDIQPFIRDTQSLNLWSYDFFWSITKDKLKTSHH